MTFSTSSSMADISWTADDNFDVTAEDISVQEFGEFAAVAFEQGARCRLTILRSMWNELSDAQFDALVIDAQVEGYLATFAFDQPFEYREAEQRGDYYIVRRLADEERLGPDYGARVYIFYVK